MMRKQPTANLPWWMNFCFTASCLLHTRPPSLQLIACSIKIIPPHPSKIVSEFRGQKFLHSQVTHFCVVHPLWLDCQPSSHHTPACVEFFNPHRHTLVGIDVFMTQDEQHFVNILKKPCKVPNFRAKLPTSERAFFSV